MQLGVLVDLAMHVNHIALFFQGLQVGLERRRCFHNRPVVKIDINPVHGKRTGVSVPRARARRAALPDAESRDRNNKKT
jgi:hypothetical protein